MAELGSMNEQLTCKERLVAERNRLQAIVKLAGMLLQPGDDGPILVAHRKFRERLMGACRGLKSDPQSDVEEFLAAEIERLQRELDEAKCMISLMEDELSEFTGSEFLQCMERLRTAAKSLSEEPALPQHWSNHA